MSAATPAGPGAGSMRGPGPPGPGPTTEVYAAFANRRQFERRQVQLAARFYDGTAEFQVLVTDISGGGARLEFNPGLSQMVSDSGGNLDIPGIGCFPASCRWRTGRSCGLAFDLRPERREALARQIAAAFPA